jgi:hypothetical protein
MDGNGGGGGKVGKEMLLVAFGIHEIQGDGKTERRIKKMRGGRIGNSPFLDNKMRRFGRKQLPLPPLFHNSFEYMYEQLLL